MKFLFKQFFEFCIIVLDFVLLFLLTILYNEYSVVELVQDVGLLRRLLLVFVLDHEKLSSGIELLVVTYHQSNLCHDYRYKHMKK